MKIDKDQATGKGKALFVLIAGIAAALAAAADHPLPPANFRASPALNAPIDLSSPDLASIQLALALVTNETRRSKGLRELAISPQLINASQMHAEDMVAGSFFSHQNPRDRNKSDPQSRARMHGVANPNIAENINQGFGIRYEPGTSIRPLGGGQFADMTGRRLAPHTPLSLAEALIAAWMKSAGHRANILHPSAISVGCGISCYSNQDFYQMPSVYAVQMFERQR